MTTTAASETTTPGGAGAGGYNPGHFDELDAVEDRHFWFAARRKIIGALAAQLTEGLPPGYHAIEIGCGNGSLLPTLQRACAGGKVIGMDLFFEGLRHARRRTRCGLVQGSVYEPPFGVEFALVGLFDVLEHIPDDAAALKAIYRLLTPGGALLMTVPAHMSLWSYFDDLSDHCRRYERAGLGEKLGAAGFEVEFLTECMLPLYPIMWASRRMRAIRERFGSGKRDATEMLSDELKVVGGVNGLMTWLLGSEAKLFSRRRRLPMGTSLLAIARKPRR